jgi:type IV pilus assembly protein PilM
MRLHRSQIQPIGLDLGLDSIKMLQLEVLRKSSAPDAAPAELRVVAAGKQTLPEEARLNPQRRAIVSAEIIQRMLSQQPFVGKRVVATLPREIVHVKNLRLPVMPLGEIEAAVLKEAGSLFQFDINEAAVQFLSAGEVRQGNQTQQEVIVLAVKRAQIDQYLEQLEKCSVVVASLDTEITGLFRAFERFIRRVEDQQEVQMLVDIGAQRTQVIISRGRNVSFCKVLEIGGLHLLDAVGRKLGITLDEAKALRQRLLESGAAVDGKSRDPVRQAVFDATRSVAEELGRELAMCLRYYSVAFRGHRPSRVRLVGGEAADPQLHAIFKSSLSVAVEAARPLFSVDCGQMRASDRGGAMSIWALAMGLGLRFTNDYFAPKDGRPRTSQVNSLPMRIAPAATAEIGAAICA